MGLSLEEERVRLEFETKGKEIGTTQGAWCLVAWVLDWRKGSFITL